MENKNNKVITEMLKSFNYLLERAIRKTTKIYDGIVVSSASNNKWNVKYNGEIHAIKIYGKTTPEANQIVKVFVPQGNNNLTWFMLPNEKSSGGGGVGENGATFTPSVSEDGIISWTNDKNLPNPSSVNIKGRDGKQGEQGPQGIQGFPGKDGAKGEQGLQGAPGKDGRDGKDGAQGVQGKQGEQGLPGESATITVGTVESVPNDSSASIINVGNKQNAVFNFKIPKGKDGAKGKDGINGKDGANGVNGKNGLNGSKVVFSQTPIEELTKTEAELDNLVNSQGTILVSSSNSDDFYENDIAVARGYISDLNVNCLIFGIVTGGSQEELQLKVFSFIKDGIDGDTGGGVTDHEKLTGRNNPNQHSIQSITGLESALNSKLSTMELQPSINSALAQAKNSGEFNATINGVNTLTIETKGEISSYQIGNVFTIESKKRKFAGTINSKNWILDGNYFNQINIPDIKSTDIPVLIPNVPNSLDTIPKQWNSLILLKSFDGNVRFYSKSKIDLDLDFVLYY